MVTVAFRLLKKWSTLATIANGGLAYGHHHFSQSCLKASTPSCEMFESVIGDQHAAAQVQQPQLGHVLQMCQPRVAGVGVQQVTPVHQGAWRRTICAGANG